MVSFFYMKIVTFKLSGNDGSITRVVRRMLDNAGFTALDFNIVDDELDESQDDYTWRERAERAEATLRNIAEQLTR